MPLDGLFDLLFKATLHPSADVCGLSLEALANIAPSNNDLSMRLLPLLQGKAIIPFYLISGEQRDIHEDLEDYMQFRERVLVEALKACYAGCGSFYLESCASAIEEFSMASSSPHLPYQLEAALFCMVAVAERATKKFQEKSLAEKQSICSQLEIIVSALAKNNFSTTSNPLVMAKMCRFISEVRICE